MPFNVISTLFISGIYFDIYFLLVRVRCYHESFTPFQAKLMALDQRIAPNEWSLLRYKRVISVKFTYQFKFRGSKITELLHYLRLCQAYQFEASYSMSLGAAKTCTLGETSAGHAHSLRRTETGSSLHHNTVSRLS